MPNVVCAAAVTKPQQHAKRFVAANDLKWTPRDSSDVVPPEAFFTNQNMEDFFIEVYETTGKPSVKQAHKWLNHALAQYQRPPVNKMNYEHYATVLDMLRGMSKDAKWKDHTTQGAPPLSKKTVKRIFEASVRDPETNELCLVRLRNKALAILMIANGWHTSDAYRLFDGDVEDHADYEDRDGVCRPKLVFRGRKCKEHVGTKNTINQCFYYKVHVY